MIKIEYKKVYRERGQGQEKKNSERITETLTSIGKDRAEAGFGGDGLLYQAWRLLQSKLS